MITKQYKVVVLFFVLILVLFAACTADLVEVPTEPSASSQPTELTEPSSEATEPSSEATEPSSEATDPTETVCPRTVEYFKSHLTPYMTYREAREILGRKDSDTSDVRDWNEAIWYLEDGHWLEVIFYPTVNKQMEEYFATMPTDETKPDGTSVDFVDYFNEWHLHMEAYRATLYKRYATGKWEVVEVWFDYGRGPFWQEEEAS